MGPAGIGSLVGLFIALAGLTMMAGRHTWEGILFIVMGGIIVGSSNTIAGYFG
jgi:type IV secretory pathway VirB2 component (pilin)